MPLEVSQEPGEPGITVKTTASEGEKLPTDEAAKVCHTARIGTTAA